MSEAHDGGAAQTRSPWGALPVPERPSISGRNRPENRCAIFEQLFVRPRAGSPRRKGQQREAEYLEIRNFVMVITYISEKL